MKLRILAALAFLPAILSVLSVPARAAGPDAAILSAASEAAQTYDLPLALILAVCETESGFDPDDGNGTCEGLMGLHRLYAGAYAREAGLSDYDLHDISDNLTIGAHILAGYCRTYDLHMALMCYNLGEAGALAARRDGVMQTRYSKLVCSRMAQYEGLGSPAPAEPEIRFETVSHIAGAAGTGRQSPEQSQPVLLALYRQGLLILVE